MCTRAQKSFHIFQDSNDLKDAGIVKKKQKARSTLTALALALSATSAHAITDEIQVYTDDINKPGDFGLELHVNTTPKGRKTPDYAGDSPPNHGLRLSIACR